jgi:hypothetical protein
LRLFRVIKEYKAMNMLRSTFMNQYKQETVASISRPLFRLVALGESDPRRRLMNVSSTAFSYIKNFASTRRRGAHTRTAMALLDLFLQSPSKWSRILFII